MVYKNGKSYLMKAEVGFNGVRSVEDLTLTGENEKETIECLENEIPLQQ